MKITYKLTFDLDVDGEINNGMSDKIAEEILKTLPGVIDINDDLYVILDGYEIEKEGI